MFSDYAKQAFGSHQCLATIENYLANSQVLRGSVPDLIQPEEFKKQFGAR